MERARYLSDLEWVSLRVEGHVFLLTQLAAIGKGKPGYLRKHPELVTKKAEPILTEQLARQSAAARDLLKRMCVLRVPIDVRGLTFLRVYQDDDSRFEWAEFGEPAELTEAEIRETEGILERLVDSSLVQCRYDEEKCELFYDLHRVIVEFLQADCQEELPKLLESVYKFYCTGKNVENPKTLEDLRPVLESQYFAFQLGNYTEAYNLLNELGKYLWRWGNWNLFRDLYEQILVVIEEEKRAVCNLNIGITYYMFGGWNLAEKYFKEALSQYQDQREKSGIAKSLYWLGNIQRHRGNWEQAKLLYRQSLEIQTEICDRSGMASCWASLGYIEQQCGNWDEAERLYRQYLEVMTGFGNRSSMAAIGVSLAAIECHRGNWDEAMRLCRQALEVMTESGDRSSMAAVWASLGDIERHCGNLDEAERLYRQALEVMTEFGERSGTAAVNYNLAQLYRQRNNTELAQQHYNTAHQIFQQLGAAKDLERIEREWEHN